MGEGSALGFAVLFDSRVSRVSYFLMTESKDIDILILTCSGRSKG